MKKNIFILALLCVGFLSAQNDLTSEDWRSDLKFLQNTVHTDYPFLFKKTTAVDFDAKVDKLYEAIPNLAAHEIIVGLARIVSSFEYGHTSLSLRQTPVEFHRLPINLYQFNDGMYVQGAHKDYQAVLGAKLLSVEGVPVEEALKMVRPVVPAENDQYFKAFGINYLCIPEVLHAQGITKELKTNVSMTFELNGTRFERTINGVAGLRVPTQYSLIQQDGEWLDARNSGDAPMYLKHLDKIYYYEYIPEKKTVYVRHSQIQDDPSEDIPSFYTRVFDFIEKNDVENLVIDVRLNGGGNNYKNKAVITRIIESQKINQQGNLFVIIGRRTFSACQNLVNEMSNYTNAMFIGEATAENINFYGDNRRVELPKSKIPAFLSFAWWQDKPQWENGDGTNPHIPIDLSFNDYKTNADPVLEAALNYGDSDLIMDPLQHFTDLFVAGKLGEIKTQAVEMANDPAYHFFDFENEFNKAAYQLLSSGQTEGAVFIFQLLTEIYPNSANAWDSLAEGYMKAGDKAKAEEYYKKAIALDPNGSVGENARNMLKQLNE